MKKFYIADWHYDHKNIIALDNRPFKDVTEMNNSLIERWNKVVSKEDIVYILGDMFWCDHKTAMNILDKLNGTKILIRGNHDKRIYELDKKFTVVVKIDNIIYGKGIASSKKEAEREAARVALLKLAKNKNE